MRLGTADVLVRAKTDKFDKDIDKSGKKVKSFGQKSKKELAGLTSSFASLAGAAGVGALTASLGGLLFVGVKFESQMATVKGVMGASEKDFKLLSDAAKKMGETTEWSANQAAEALNFMGMAGWSVGQSIKALPEVLNLATSGSLDLGRASDIVTDSLTAMGLGVQDLSRFNDILTGTFTSTNTTVEMIGETLKYVAPIASSMGYEIEELSAMLGTLAQSGIKASDAGTDLRQAFIKNASAAKVLGTEADDLIGTLEAATEAGWGVTEMTKHYGLIALKSVLKLQANLGFYKELADELHNVEGATKKLADIKLDTVSGDFKILRSAIEGVGLAAYENIKGQLRESLQDMTKFVSDHKQDFVDFAKSAKEIGGHLAVIGKHVGSFLSNTLKGWNALPDTVKEIGLFGAVLGGKKGIVALLATAHMAEWAETIGKSFALVSTGVLDISQVATANLKELQELVHRFDFPDPLKDLQFHAKELREEIDQLKKATEGRIFTFRGDKEKLIELQNELKNVELKIIKIKEKASEVVPPPEEVVPPPEEVVPPPEEVVPPPIKIDDTWIKSMQAQETFALKMAESEQERLNARYELEKEINAKVHDELLSDTEFRLHELDSQFLAYDGFVKDKAALDAWYVENYEEITSEVAEQEKVIREEQAGAWERYAETAGTAIQDVGKMSLSMTQSFAQGAGDAFASAIAHGESLGKTFEKLMKNLAHQVISSLIKIGIERTVQWLAGKILLLEQATSRIAAASATVYANAFSSVIASVPYPANIALAPIVAGATTAAMQAGVAGAGAAGKATGSTVIMDEGGITHAGGLYRTGNIDEAHVPLPSGRKIPVELSGRQERPTIIIHMENPVFQDNETQLRVFAQIAEVVARQVAPDAVIENFNNDEEIRQMVTGGY